MRKWIGLSWMLFLTLPLGCPSSGGGNGGGESGVCQEPAPGCCYSPEHTLCKGLPLEECRSRSDCSPIEGVPFDDLDAPESFVGCSSQCDDDGPVCGYDPAKPESCFAIGVGLLPDGWVKLASCNNPPAACVKP